MYLSVRMKSTNEKEKKALPHVGVSTKEVDNASSSNP